MSVKLKVLSAGVLFFLSSQAVEAQKKTSDSLRTRDIDEVVVLGYSKTSTKTKSVSASTTISSSVLENRPTASFLNSIQGSAPGISVNSESGSPGSGKINVSIRGVGSLSASTDPLYVIDGLISSANEFRNLNSNDIETVSILRDAQATAIYGNYGANGVVVITTKTGNYNSGLRVSYDVSTSFSQIPKHNYNIMTSGKEILAFNKSIGVNPKRTLYIQQLAGVDLGYTLSASDVGSPLTDDEVNNYAVSTNWNNEIFRTAFTQQHNVGIRYGAENFTSYTSLGYLDNEGNVKSTDFKRFTFRNNITGRSKNKRLSYTSQLALGFSKRHQLDEETNSGVANNLIQNPLLGLFTNAYVASYPFANGQEMYNLNGLNFNYGAGNWVLQDILNGGVKKQYNQTSIQANVSAIYKITDDISVSNKTGVNYRHNYLDSARDPKGYLAIAVAKAQTRSEYGGSESIQNVFDTTLNSVTSVNYDKKFGQHSLNVGVLLDYLRGFYSVSTQTKDGLDPLNWVFGAGTGYVPFNIATPSLYQSTISAGKISAGTLAYVGTLDYDFASKYGISATVRRDASYRFSDENKWETFWSVGARWNVGKENFMQGSIFDDFKLRASYGTNGNQNLSAPSNNVNPLFVDSNLIRDTYGTVTGYQNTTAYNLSVLANSSIQWEKISQANIGLDFSLFRRKLEGSIDVYEKTTKDMYLSTPISGVNGVYTIKGNNGTLRNRGIEATMRYTPIKNENLRLSVFGNFSYNQNKITELPSEDLSGILVNAVGGPAYQWYAIRYAGVNQTNGEHLFYDKDGNLTENPTDDDRVFTDKSVYAPYKGGFGLDIDYKGFYLTSIFSFQAGGWSRDTMDIWMHTVDYLSNNSPSRDLLNAWTPTNTNTDVGAVYAKNRLRIADSDKYLYKTDYIKLKNLAIGYNLSKNMLTNLPVRSMKVYLMAENLLTITNWKGFDPEPIKSSVLGVYPNPKTYSLGLSVEF